MISTSENDEERDRRACLATQQQVLHRAFSPIRNDKALSRALTTARNSMVFRFGAIAAFGALFGQPRHGRQEIEKRSFYLLGGPCFEGTLRKCFLSESSPVAGTIENLNCSLET